MTCHGKWASFGTGILYFALVASGTTPSQTGAGASTDKIERARIAFSHALPELDGGHLDATIVEVTYGPGEASRPHSHPCAVMGYILEGALRTQVKGEPERIYKAGESFYEAPNVCIRSQPTPANKSAQNSLLILFAIARDRSASMRQGPKRWEGSSHGRNIDVTDGNNEGEQHSEVRSNKLAKHRLAAGGNSLCAFGTGSIFPFRNRRPFWPVLRKECRLRKF